MSRYDLTWEKGDSGKDYQDYVLWVGQGTRKHRTGYLVRHIIGKRLAEPFQVLGEKAGYILATRRTLGEAQSNAAYLAITSEQERAR